MRLHSGVESEYSVSGTNIPYIEAGSSPGCNTSVPGPCLTPGKVVEDGSGLCAPVPTRESGGSSDFWLWMASAPAVALSGAVNQWMEVLLSLTLLFLIVLPFK